MTTSSISSASTPADTLSASDSSRVPIKVMGQEDFLRLLVTQMTTQDPLHPREDTQFIAQMAQFSALEQSRAMQTDIARMRTDQHFLQADALLGRVVELQVGQDQTAVGIVEAVKMEAGTPKLLVNGERYELDQVMSVSPLPDLKLPPISTE